MAWNTDLVLMLRVLISDIAEPQTYTDAYLEQVIVVAGIIVDADIPFANTYVYDVTLKTIAPDPVTLNDSAFMSLVPLKSACILTVGEFKSALGQGIKVRDGDSAIDTSVSFKGYRDILELGPCKAYEKLRWALLASGGAGKAVLGPYRSPGGSAESTISWYYDQFLTTNSGRRDRS